MADVDARVITLTEDDDTKQQHDMLQKALDEGYTVFLGQIATIARVPPQEGPPLSSRKVMTKHAIFAKPEETGLLEFDDD